MEELETGAFILGLLCLIISLPGWITAAVGWPIVHHWSWMLFGQGVGIFWCGLGVVGVLILLMMMLGMNPLDEIGVGSRERYGD